MASVAGSKPSDFAEATVFKAEAEVQQEARLKRLARIDRHTLLQGEMDDLKACSNAELQKLLGMKEATYEIKAAAGELLRKRLDPEDQGTVEV